MSDTPDRRENVSQTLDDLYTDAKLHVRCHPGLWRLRQIILSEAFCREEDHLRWIVTAPPDEVEAWAAEIDKTAGWPGENNGRLD